MGEFFKGWRRKAGVVTLAMACALTAMWVRSEIAYDEVRLFDYSLGYQTASSFRGGLTWEVHAYVSYEELRSSYSDIPLSFDEHFEDGIFVIDNADVVFARRQFAGVEFTNRAEAVLSDGHYGSPANCSWERIQSIEVPYWSITTPLILLSAYLILWKRRTRAA